MEPLYTPTDPRNEQEGELLEEISSDLDLKSPGLRQKAAEYIGDTLALVYWRHLDSQVRVSFEDPGAAHVSRAEHRDTFPRILGIRAYQDLAENKL